MTWTRRNVLRAAGLMGLQTTLAGGSVSLLGLGRAAGRQPGRFLVLSLSTAGDPLNANVPGSYVPGVVHPNVPHCAPTQLRLAGQGVLGAQVFTRLPQKLLDRTVFFHHATGKNSHPSLPALLDVLPQGLCAPWWFAKELAPRLGTVLQTPLLLGAEDVVSVGNDRPPSLSPQKLRELLSGQDLQAGPLASWRGRLQALQTGKSAQAKRLGAQIVADLGRLEKDGDDGPNAQVSAAAIAVALGLAPVVAIRIPFGGDNHFDAGLVKEATELRSGVEQIAALWQKLTVYGMSERTCFAHFSVFGRTLKRHGQLGRDHTPHHNVALLQGAPFRGGVIGGIAAHEDDFAAQAIDRATADSSARFWRTLGQGLGVGA